MSALVSVVGRAKAQVDAGFSRVGRGLAAGSPRDRALMILAARALSAANALCALCERGHANEALPLLRAAAEWALLMRSPRAEAGLPDPAGAPAAWSALSDEELARLARQAGASSRALEAALDARAFRWGNAGGLPWGHAAAEGLPRGRPAEEVLSAAAHFLGHALKALDERWPGAFPGAESMWADSQI